VSDKDCEWEHGYADVNDIRLHYVACGEGRLMLFLHGFPEFWAAWESQLHLFGRRFQAVAIDLRGYNLSSKPMDPKQYHVRVLVEDIRLIAEHLGHRKMILVAHDWGGGVAWAFANRYPDYLEKLIIINSPHPAIFARELLDNARQQEASGYMNMLRAAEAENLLAADNFAFLTHSLTGGGSRWRMPQDVYMRYIEAWSQPGALTGGLNYYRVSPLHPPQTKDEAVFIRSIAQAPREVFAVQVPTLVIWAEQDSALLPGNLDGLDAYVDDLTIQRIPDGTHWVIHEQPEAVNRYIQDFIEK
jgi:epoxide hydrolase 4